MRSRLQTAPAPMGSFDTTHKYTVRAPFRRHRTSVGVEGTPTRFIRGLNRERFSSFSSGKSRGSHQTQPWVKIVDHTHTHTHTHTNTHTGSKFCPLKPSNSRKGNVTSLNQSWKPVAEKFPGEQFMTLKVDFLDRIFHRNLKKEGSSCSVGASERVSQLRVFDETCGATRGGRRPACCCDTIRS